MSSTTSRPPVAGQVTALTVHGPGGVVDLTVPVDATMADVAGAYDAEARTGRVLPLVTRTGRALAPDVTVGAARLESGAVLVAVDGAPPPKGRAGRRAAAARSTGLEPGPLSGLWCAIAAALAVGAGWSAGQLPGPDRLPVVLALAAAAVLACLPVGPLAAQRIVAAPAFAAAACLAQVWDPEPERLPTVLGAAALAGAVLAAVARALNDESEEALRVWMVVGGAWFAVAALAALSSAAPQVVWTLLLIAAVLAARFVPMVAIDVPDQYLIDLERLAVTAWSARDRPPDKRGRTVVPPQAVAAVATRGARLIVASTVAIAVVTAFSAPLLLLSVPLPVDRIGARCLLGFGGCTLLLAARSYRHAAARRMLNLAGVWCLAVLAWEILPLTGPDGLGLLAGAAIALAVVLVVVAVLVGRGWRSGWWSRRAEVAEAVCGSFALGSVVVAVGLFRHLWELTS